MRAGVTGLSLLITPFIIQLSTRYLQLDADDGKVLFFLCFVSRAREAGSSAA